MRGFSSVFIIAQSDTRNIDYLINWLQEMSRKSLEQLLFFDEGPFSEHLVFKVFTFWKELVCFINCYYLF